MYNLSMSRSIAINQVTRFGRYGVREFGTIDGHASSKQQYISNDGREVWEHCIVANGQDDTTVYSAASSGYGDSREPRESACSSCYLGFEHTRWAHFQAVNAVAVNDPWARIERPSDIAQAVTA